MNYRKLIKRLYTIIASSTPPEGFKYVCLTKKDSDTLVFLEQISKEEFKYYEKDRDTGKTSPEETFDIKDWNIAYHKLLSEGYTPTISSDIKTEANENTENTSALLKRLEELSKAAKKGKAIICKEISAKFTELMSTKHKSVTRETLRLVREISSAIVKHVKELEPLTMNPDTPLGERLRTCSNYIKKLTEIINNTNDEWTRIKAILDEHNATVKDEPDKDKIKQIVGADFTDCWQIDNKVTNQKYQQRKAALDKQGIPYEEKYSMHASPSENWASIAASGLNTNQEIAHGNTYGNGIYFSDNYNYIARYSQGESGEMYIGLFKILCKKVSKVEGKESIDSSSKLGQPFISDREGGNDPVKMILVADPDSITISHIILI